MDVDPRSRLRVVGEAIANAEAVVEALMPERDELIRQALRPPFNYSQRTVARLAKLQQQRIDQINRGTR